MKNLINNSNIPENMDAFDQDAKDGFSSVVGADSYFKRKNTSSFTHQWKWILLGVGMIGFFVMVIPFNSTVQKNETSDLKQKAEVKKTQETIPIIPQKFEQLPQHQLVKSSFISDNFKAQKVDNLVDNDVDFDISILPINQLEGIKGEELELAQNVAKRTGICTYAYDLKLLDYTKYRDATNFRFQNKEVELTGVNASKISDKSEEFTLEYQEVSYIDLIDAATYEFSKGRYKNALAQYETVLKVFPEDVNALFYGAICYRNFGNYTKSIDLLESLLFSKYDNFDEEALFYLAENHLKMKNTIKAAKYLKQILGQKGFYAKRAAIYLKDIKDFK
jgi:tetratricopeptide (TPR) repeat protein